MATTIFKTLLVDSIPGETKSKSRIRQVVRKHTKDNVYDGQAIYDELVRLNGLAAPGPEEKETFLYPWQNAGCILLQDGSPAGIKITWRDKKTYVEIFAV